MEHENGIVIIDNLPIKNSSYDNIGKILKFDYNNKTYYYKEVIKISELYNELIAEEIANDFNIPHVSYNLASYDLFDSIGVVSEDFIKDKTYIYMEQVLLSVYGKELLNEVNNLEDIFNALCIYFKDIDLANKLYNQILELCIFDILIANADRHDRNYGFEIDGKDVNLGKVYDNCEMLSSMAIYEGYYRIGISRGDTYEFSSNLLKKFIKEHDDRIRELLKSKLNIISEENILNIIDRVEKKINHKIEDSIKFKIIQKFKINREIISRTIEESYVYRK